MRVELNIDLGELASEPPELYSLANRVNVACGGHAGDDDSMRLAARRALASGALVGAHPSYEDCPNFGRIPLNLDARSLHASVARQCRRLRALASSEGVSIVHVKAHGALYHSANTTESIARAFVEGATETLGEIAIVGPPKGFVADVARGMGLRFLREGFADRGYRGDGGLVARGTPGALLDEAAAVAQARKLARAGTFDTLCVHSDTPDALAVARAVKAALELA